MQVVVVGSNRGIGLELARIYRERGDAVVGACRKSSDALKATGAEVVEGIDVGGEGAGAALRKALGDRHVDVLVVAAGILKRQSLDDVDDPGLLEQLVVNAVGPLRVVAALRNNLGKGSKVGLITSRMGSIDDNTSGGSYGYRMSKTALNMAGRSLAHDLAPAGVSVMLLHPGFVRTDMTGGHGDVDAPTSAAGLVARLDELTPETSGTFRHANGQTLPW